LATVVNYMDRLTVNFTAKRIQNEFGLSNEDYGSLETGFGISFAVGSTVFGLLADRINLRWLFPVVLVAWSVMGFLTGMVTRENIELAPGVTLSPYLQMMLCRVFLGFFEAGNFPCGLRTVQRLLAPSDRPLGNSMLQAGTALGAIITPMVVWMLVSDQPGSWRLPFLVIGASGLVWVAFWLASVSADDLRPEPAPAPSPTPSAGTAADATDTLWRAVLSGRFVALAVMVVCVNTNWHLCRVWMSKFLQEGRGYHEGWMFWIEMGRYVAADVGIMTAGWLSLRLARGGMDVFAARMWVYLGCCLICGVFNMTMAALPAGPVMLAFLILSGCGALGCFAAYYSMTQDLSLRHQGTLAGVLATITWAVSPLHKEFGRHLDNVVAQNIGNPDAIRVAYEQAFTLVGWLPMVSLLTILALWDRRAKVAAIPAGATAH
jgi:ACS family hexuronate transporter-like MFS transporter